MVNISGLALSGGTVDDLAGGVLNHGLLTLVEVRIASNRLANVSTRGLLQMDDNVMIGGIFVVGTLPAETLVHAIGPSLPIAVAVADPTLSAISCAAEIIRNFAS